MSLAPVRTSRSPGARTRILDGAALAAGRHGYTSTRVEDVISACGASRATFYGHFADLDDCLLAAAQQFADELVAAAEARTGINDPERAPIVAAEVLLDFAAAQPAGARLLFSVLLGGGERALDLRDATIDRLARPIQSAWAAGASPAQTHDLPARTIVATIFRVLSRRMRFGGRGPHLLDSTVLEWLDSYTVPAPTPYWQNPETMLTATTDDRPLPSRPTARPPIARSTHGRAQRRSEQRERLLRASADAVYRRGFRAATVADICGIAQVSRGAFYSNWSNREAISTEAVALTVEALRSATARAFLETSPWRAQLWDGLTALVGCCRADPALSYLLFVESHAVGEAAARLADGLMSDLPFFLESGYRESPYGTGLLHSTSEVLAAAIFELFPSEHPARLLPQLAYICLAPFLGPQAATAYVRERLSETASG